MSTGPTATRARSEHPLYRKVRTTDVITKAWRDIRSNAETSKSRETREESRRFDAQAPKLIRAIQKRLRDGYAFAPAYGATPAKKGKAGKRPLVIAPLEDRIVQRAILNVLQGATKIKPVQDVLTTPTSIGGIPGRGVDHAIQLIQDRFDAGDVFFAGSDISAFFTRIPRDQVVAFVRAATRDDLFCDLLDRALTVELANADKMDPEDRRLFPTGNDGVAQGCPLSALAGNIILRQFDAEMNGRGVTCIRYIDDFLLMGQSRDQVARAMTSAGKRLGAMGMSIYDPTTDPKKAFIGRVGDSHVFLGYQLLPGRYPPSPDACDRLLRRIERELQEGRRMIRTAAAGVVPAASDRCYAQTLAHVNNIMRGWRTSFAATQDSGAFDRLDDTIGRRLKDFTASYLRMIKNADEKQRRRATGVTILADPISARGERTPT